MGDAPLVVARFAHRTRYESLRHTFRAQAPGHHDGLFTRTGAHLTFGRPWLHVEAEVVDSRLFWVAPDTPLNTGLGNALDLLQARVVVQGDGVLVDGDRAVLRVGRMTFDLGGRRLVARNGFRNTINAFTGADLSWECSNAADLPNPTTGLRLFALMPVTRAPGDRAPLANNAVRLDREQTGSLLWGAWGSVDVGALSLEGYLVGLFEADQPTLETRDRRLLSPGLRLLSAPRPGHWDMELEVVAQWGTSRATRQPDDVQDLTHRAWFAHAALGYTWEVRWRPRLELLGDVATGDDDPKDRVQGRFDTLFGARRFELGPTGLFGAFARANIRSPGLRLQVSPLSAVKFTGAWRPFWLDAVGDAWGPSGARDLSGRSGRFVAHQIEARVQWHVLPGHLTLEAGAAHLVLGGFARQAAKLHQPPTFSYVQLSTKI